MGFHFLTDMENLDFLSGHATWIGRRFICINNACKRAIDLLPVLNCDL